MWYTISAVVGGLLTLGGMWFARAADNWRIGLTWRGHTRHEGRQS